MHDSLWIHQYFCWIFRNNPTSPTTGVQKKPFSTRLASLQKTSLPFSGRNISPSSSARDSPQQKSPISIPSPIVTPRSMNLDSAHLRRGIKISKYSLWSEIDVLRISSSFPLRIPTADVSLNGLQSSLSAHLRDSEQPSRSMATRIDWACLSESTPCQLAQGSDHVHGLHRR